tara:strand:+ start:674 stop:1096 length:423 start_codon:yes stop_codon:yes gene_type:complete
MKTCIKCSEEKPLTEYYAHQQMADKHLNVCKDCVKKRVRAYGRTPRGKAVDKKRNQKPKRKAWVRAYSAQKNKKFAKERKCRQVFWNRYRAGVIKKKPCEVCGTEERVEAHHPNYNEPLNVMWLCASHHKEWHRENETTR